MPAADFAQRVIEWQRDSGRHDLPWQHDVSPYRTWVSEIMLQQTQVVTVIDYFNKFTQIFPNISSLAAADEDEVLHHWSGLGYYSRARNLLRTARIVCDEYAGQLPRDFDALVSLPGIGRSTAGAILALSWGDRFSILDGNARRVLARHAGVRSWPGKRETENYLWELANSYTPSRDVAVYTQGIMDIGATICRRGKPRCASCPVNMDCVAFSSGAPESFPGRKPKRAIPIRSTWMLVIRNELGVMLERRPVGGVWGGLWSFPEVNDEKQFVHWWQQRFQGESPNIKSLAPFRHTFTHFHLDVQPLLIETNIAPTEVMDDQDWLWYNDASNQPVGLAAPVKRMLQDLEQAEWEST